MEEKKRKSSMLCNGEKLDFEGKVQWYRVEEGNMSVRPEPRIHRGCNREF